MDEFQQALYRQLQRSATLQSALAPSEDRSAQTSIQVLAKANEFITAFRASKGFTKFHPAFTAQTVATCHSLAHGTSFQAGRGNGRLATVLDYTNTSGHGTAQASKTLCKAFDLEDLHWEYDETTERMFPVFEQGLPKSKAVLERLYYLIKRRERVRNGADATTPQIKSELLLKGTWKDDQKFIGHTIELLARAFAYNVPKEDRKRLFSSEDQISLKAAFDHLSFAPA